jgi:hypothetical protein
MILHLHIKIVNENEGLEKANRGDEYEPIKIPLENSAYVLKSIHHASLLTRQHRIAIEKLLILRTELVNLKSQWKMTLMQLKSRVRLRQPKIDQQTTQSLTHILSNT